MKLLCVKRIFLVAGFSILLTNVFAQNTNKPKTTKTKTTNKTTQTADPFGGSNSGNNNGGNNTDPFGANQNKTNTTPNNKAKTNTSDPFGVDANSGKASAGNNNKKDTTGKKTTLPYTFKQSESGNPLTTVSKPSNRLDNGSDENKIRDRTPMPYDYIREDDAFFRERLWSIIDAREKMNLIFKDPRVDDNGSQMFFAILYKAVATGEVQAFSDDAFRDSIPKSVFIKKFSGGLDTIPVKGDLDNPDKVTGYEVRQNDFPIDSVYQFQIKEDIIFDKESSRLVHRIIGIAPMAPPILNGKIIEGVGNQSQIQFWVYYPELRALLAKYRIYNPKNMGARMTWEDMFEAHMFSSYIVKSTLNNFKDEYLKAYIHDPLFRLLEGEKIKEKIFNFEQNLWQY